MAAEGDDVSKSVDGSSTSSTLVSSLTNGQAYTFVVTTIFNDTDADTAGNESSAVSAAGAVTPSGEAACAAGQPRARSRATAQTLASN